MNPRETYLLDRIARKADERRGVLAARDAAQNHVAALMREIICPTERRQMARELVTASVAVMAQASGHVPTGAHLQKLAGDVFAAGEIVAGRER